MREVFLQTFELSAPRRALLDEDVGVEGRLRPERNSRGTVEELLGLLTCQVGELQRLLVRIVLVPTDLPVAGPRERIDEGLPERSAPARLVFESRRVCLEVALQDLQLAIRPSTTELV